MALAHDGSRAKEELSSSMAMPLTPLPTLKLSPVNGRVGGFGPC